MDEPRFCHREWSMTERGKHISYISVYIRNLQKWHWWTYFQNRNRDEENGLVGTVGEGGGGMTC